MASNDDLLENSTVIIPLHLSLEYPCDYIDQTAKILSKNSSIIYFDYHRPYSWKNLLRLNNLKSLLSSFIDISKSKKIVYFRAPSILPFSKSKIITNLNKKIGFFILSIILWFLKKRTIIWQFSTLIKNKVFKDQFFIYDCVDYKNSEDEDKKYFSDEAKLFKISNVISFNSKGLFENKLKNNPILVKKSVVSVCGCNNKLFLSKNRNIPREYTSISKKMILFMGVFDFRIDVRLLSYIVSNNKNKKFIFIGPIRKSVEKLFGEIIKEKNVIYLGKKRKNELPIYLNKCSLGIIPYEGKNKFVRYSNPMKAYEYLGSGIPVVSTNVLALKNFPKDIVYTTDNNEEFNKAITRLINNWDDKKISIARDIAEKNSWENKIKLIKNFINKK